MCLNFSEESASSSTTVTRTDDAAPLASEPAVASSNSPTASETGKDTPEKETASVETGVPDVSAAGSKSPTSSDTRNDTPDKEISSVGTDTKVSDVAVANSNSPTASETEKDTPEKETVSVETKVSDVSVASSKSPSAPETGKDTPEKETASVDTEVPDVKEQPSKPAKENETVGEAPAKGDAPINPAAPSMMLKGPATKGEKNIQQVITPTSPTKMIQENGATAVNNSQRSPSGPEQNREPQRHRGRVQATHVQRGTAAAHSRNIQRRPRFVETLDPENIRPLNNAELREVCLTLSSNGTSLALTNKLFVFMGTMLESASEHLQKGLVRSVTPSSPADAAAKSPARPTTGWGWEDIDVLITAMPPFSRLLMYKHLYGRQVRVLLRPACLYSPPSVVCNRA